MKPPTANTFGQALRRARLAAGLTQAEAAEAMGIGQPLWSDYERGRRRPAIDQAANLAAAVGLELADLVTDRCTFKQARVLARFGYPADASFAEAVRLIDGLAANNWKRPAGL